MAIAHESSTPFAKSTSATSHTIPHTNTSGDLLVAGFNCLSTAGDVVTGVTYNGVALTKVSAGAGVAANGRTANLWYLASPATGTNDLVITFSVSERTWGAVSSYTGADTTTPEDTSAVGTTPSGTTITNSITTTADDVMLYSSNYFNRGWSANGTNTTTVYLVDGNTHTMRSTTNVATAGATSLSFTTTTSEVGASHVIGAFRSAPAAPASNIKSISGLAKADIKSMAGLAIG
jgi:hypothetical protein